MEAKRLEALKQIAAGIAAQFGDKCEVVIHDVGGGHPEHTIVHIENGHVSGRKVGDGASQVVLDQMATQVRSLVDGMAAGPGKFDIRGLGGAAIGGDQQLSVRLFRVADIVNGRFQR